MPIKKSVHPFCFESPSISSVASIGAKLVGKVITHVAEEAIDVAEKGVDLVKKIDDILTAKMDAHFNAVAKPPPSLIGPAAIGQIAKNMDNAKEIDFEQTPGFGGEFLTL